MNRVEMLSAIKGAINNNQTNFSAVEANELLVKGFAEYFGLEDMSPRSFNVHQAEIFALIEEVIDEMLPKAVTDVIGSFAEVKSFGRDDEVVFKMENRGKRRARKGIVKGARGGIYKARTLDNSYFTMDVDTYTVGVFVTLEEILLGKTSINDLFKNILEGFSEIVYQEAYNALVAAEKKSPDKNKGTGTGFDPVEVDKLIAIVKAYGTPVIVGFSTALAQIYNAPGWVDVSPNVNDTDINEIRSMGRVSLYKGIRIIELPNFLEDESNAKWMFDESKIFILPTDSKPVKVAFKGDLHIEDNKHPSGSYERQAHKLMGVGLQLVNDVCTYTVGAGA